MNSRVLPVLALIVAVLIFFGYVSPAWNGSIASTKAAIAQDDQALTASTQYGARENQLASAESAISSDDLNRLATFLPGSVDNVQLILDLDALASRSGVVLSKVDVQSSDSSSGAAGNTASAASAPTGAAGMQGAPQASAGPIGSVDLSLSATGSYSAFRTFLSGIENSERILDVRALSVKGSDTSVYTYDMKLRIYWLR